MLKHKKDREVNMKTTSILGLRDYCSISMEVRKWKNTDDGMSANGGND